MQLISIAVLCFLTSGVVQAGGHGRPPLDPGLLPTTKPSSGLRERGGGEAAPVVVVAAEDK